jgi:hypothetical protein
LACQAICVGTWNTEKIASKHSGQEKTTALLAKEINLLKKCILKKTFFKTVAVY